MSRILEDPLVPLGEPPMERWLWLRLPPNQLYLMFTFLDGAGKPCSRGAPLPPRPTREMASWAATHPDHTLVDPGFWPGRVLSVSEVEGFGLPTTPTWYRRRLSGGTPWREDPRLRTQFHQSYPDDLEVLLLARNGSEKLWVRVTGCATQPSGYLAELLHVPLLSRDLQRGQTVTIRPSRGCPLPVLLTPAIVSNLQHWSCCCSGCGFDLCHEPIPDVIQRQSGTSARSPLRTRCAMCACSLELERRNPSLALRFTEVG